MNIGGPLTLKLILESIGAKRWLCFNYTVLPEKSLMMSFPNEAVSPCTLWTYSGSHIYAEKKKYHMFHKEF